MNKFVTASFLSILIALQTASVYAETTGWSWGGIFSSKTSKTDVGVQSVTSKSSWMPEWKMPDVAGSVKKVGMSVSTTTSNAWNVTSRSTKQAWKKTTEMLDPFPDDKNPKATSTSTSGSGFSGMFGVGPVDDRPKTVNDFLGQDRLQ
jgi:hypothetical protein